MLPEITLDYRLLSRMHEFAAWAQAWWFEESEHHHDVYMTWSVDTYNAMNDWPAKAWWVPLSDLYPWPYYGTLSLPCSLKMQLTVLSERIYYPSWYSTTFVSNQNSLINAHVYASIQQFLIECSACSHRKGRITIVCSSIFNFIWCQITFLMTICWCMWCFSVMLWVAVSVRILVRRSSYWNQPHCSVQAKLAKCSLALRQDRRDSEEPVAR